MRNICHEIIHFWFSESGPAQWFQKDEDFDALIRDRFMMAYDMARDGLSDDWQNEAAGCLALCILLDQFPRNMFRDTSRAFESDEKALRIARHAVKQGFDKELPPFRRRFIYMPYEHSETLADQEKAVALFATMKQDDPLGYDYAVKHYDVIKAFGRFPHRNKILGRDNTPEEDIYLAQPGAGF